MLRRERTLGYSPCEGHLSVSSHRYSSVIPGWEWSSLTILDVQGRRFEQERQRWETDGIKGERDGQQWNGYLSPCASMTVHWAYTRLFSTFLTKKMGIRDVRRVSANSETGEEGRLSTRLILPNSPKGWRSTLRIIPSFSPKGWRSTLRIIPYFSQRMEVSSAHNPHLLPKDGGQLCA